MRSINQKFRKPYKQWTDKEKQQIECFFLSNCFISKFYQKKKFQRVARICLYRKLEPGQKLALQKNNRAEAIILLSETIIIKKKKRKMDKRQNSTKLQMTQKNQIFSQIMQQQIKEQEYIVLGNLKKFNQTITLNYECIVEAPQQKGAEIIFIPFHLFNNLQEEIQRQRVQKIEKVIEVFFPKLNKQQLHQLSQTNCIFRQYKINNYIYQACSKPEDVFILIEGIVKLEKPGFSEQKFRETILVNAGTIFGYEDIKLESRSKSAIAGTSYVQVLTIPKSAFLKFAFKALPDMVFQDKIKAHSANKLESSLKSKIQNTSENSKCVRSTKVTPEKNGLFPEIEKKSRFHLSNVRIQNSRSQIEKKREYELMKNSHRLIDLNSRTKKSIQFQKVFPKYKKQIDLLIQKQKNKIKKMNQKILTRIQN